MHAILAQYKRRQHIMKKKFHYESSFSVEYFDKNALIQITGSLNVFYTYSANTSLKSGTQFNLLGIDDISNIKPQISHSTAVGYI